MLLFLILWVLTTFLLLAFVLRTAPLLVPPVLVVRHPSNFTTLGLGSNQDKPHGDE
jgi:hypothetical protein